MRQLGFAGIALMMVACAPSTDDDTGDDDDDGDDCLLLVGEWVITWTLAADETDPDCDVIAPQTVASNGNLTSEECGDPAICECTFDPLDAECVGGLSQVCADGDTTTALDCTYERRSDSELVGTCRYTFESAVTTSSRDCSYDLSGSPV